MANALYNPGREGFLDGSIDWDTDDIRILLIDSSDGFTATDKFVSDVTAGAIVARSTALGTKTIADGVAGAADKALSAVTTGHTCAVIIYKYNASDASARLIAWLDTGTNFPIVTNGGDVTVQWDTGANKIFKL